MTQSGRIESADSKQILGQLFALKQHNLHSHKTPEFEALHSLPELLNYFSDLPKAS